MRSERDNPGANKSGLAGTSFWLILLALSIIVFGANAGIASWQGSRYADASKSAAQIQLLSQQLTDRGREAVVTGSPEAFATLRQNRAEINNALKSLENIFGNKASDPLRRMASAWGPLGKNVDQIVASEPAISALFGNMDGLVNGVPEFQKTLNEVVRAMVVGGSPSTQIDKVLELSAESGAMISQVADIRAGRVKAEDSAEQLALTAQRFNQTLSGLQNGDPELGITAIHNNPAAVSGLRRAQSQWGTMRQSIDAILENTKSLSGAQTAAVELGGIDSSMIRYSEALLSLGSTRDKSWFPNVWLGVASGLISLFSIIGLTISLNRSQRREQELRYQTQHEFNSRNQQAIMRLLDEISSLGEGDLTVRASVTEDMTGAIADAVNYAVEELRNLVTTINDTSVQVAASSQETQATAMQLAEAANHQAEQISAASERINEIASSIQKVSRNSTESAEVAQRSVLIAAEGAGVVRETIKGMDQIRGQILETSKRIKRLGES
ncbi:MAG: methyl-accepting chemotaxis protein, partial [Xanthomonadaceae bacterium]|nr:methyl-accepting chemotaxis protein [Xanthomonadaceae bacterium]